MFPAKINIIKLQARGKRVGTERKTCSLRREREMVFAHALEVHELNVTSQTATGWFYVARATGTCALRGAS